MLSPTSFCNLNHKNTDLICFSFEWLSPEMRMWIITLWKQTLYNHFPQEQSFWLIRTHGVGVRARTLESSENVSRSSPQRLRRIYPSGGKVSRKNKWSEQAWEDESSIWGGAACGKISQLWKLWQSCVMVKGTRFPKKLRIYCLGKAELKCKSGEKKMLLLYNR